MAILPFQLNFCWWLFITSVLNHGNNNWVAFGIERLDEKKLKCKLKELLRYRKNGLTKFSGECLEYIKSPLFSIYIQLYRALLKYFVIGLIFIIQIHWNMFDLQSWKILKNQDCLWRKKRRKEKLWVCIDFCAIFHSAFKAALAHTVKLLKYSCIPTMYL